MPRFIGSGLLLFSAEAFNYALPHIDDGNSQWDTLYEQLTQTIMPKIRRTGQTLRNIGL